MKRNNALVACILFSTLLSCQKRETVLQAPEPVNPKEVIPKSAINAFIKDQLFKTNQFDWKSANDNMVWSALLQGDSILTVGYQPAGFADLDKKIDQIDVNSNDWRSVRNQVMNLVLENERGQKNAIAKDAVVFPENKLPYFTVKVSHLATVKALRASRLVRYAEPAGYGAFMDERSNTKFAVTASAPSTKSDLLSFGCGSNNPKTDLIAGTDYTAITPGAKQSWNHPYHHITEAWTKSTGQNVKVMIIDTGVSPDQANLGSLFNQGASSGRTIQKLVTYPGATPADVCGHGTSMAGAMAAPRGTSGSAAGIAYNCNLAVVNAAENVVLLSSESQQGVANAYLQGGDDAAVKIISMSLGTPFSVSSIRDAVRYANNKKKLIFCAAGTSFSIFAGWVGVIFPANMPEVYAVTGVKDNLTQRCESCHVGSEVAFTIVMEKVSNGRNPLSTAMSGDVPSTVGGSSVATASCAGIAALVWSKYPAYPRDSIVARMKRASSYASNKNPDFGWGIVNASLAVGQ
ncbi:S8 family peptidase [Chitinophaga nivalis]|uniref:S8/S53 family peptidase n=1 Tax=Chitinophaga nivalis TaxID=2991709 RepID=A0ABT3IJ47_9BACT|nr:S8/S53 family peptidase [Chitinophaga nivalis]MCW3466329.1 S8/S53 family peptidase [Chitinophaga nivalis]MCW3483980.1 S8/S53 family peptidase [Chitinophaga nivalis]